MNIASIVVGAVIMLFGFAGGGGSSSSSSSSSGSWSSSSSSSSSSSDSSGSYSDDGTILMVVVLTSTVIAGIVGYNKEKNKDNNLKTNTESSLSLESGSTASGTVYNKNPVYSSRPNFQLSTDHNDTEIEKRIHLVAEHIFRIYQEDWTEFRIDNIRSFTTERYYQHACLMLELLKSLHRTNRVSQLTVDGVFLLTPVNSDTALPAKVRVCFVFSGLDEVIEDDGRKLYSHFVSYATEYWNFIYDGQTMRLDGISQPTESSPHLVKSLAVFAEQNHLFYSPDWGRYCLPSRGLIFNSDSMEIADVNNHIVGKWDECLIQLYTYAEAPGELRREYYIIGQISVPKSYHGVIVQSHKFKSKKPDSAYEKHDMEWEGFNNRYDVYSAPQDALPAFELLNPKFMEFLYGKNPKYNLEVIDNIIYIFAKIKHVTEKDYADMLDVLREAYNELKM